MPLIRQGTAVGAINPEIHVTDRWIMRNLPLARAGEAIQRRSSDDHVQCARLKWVLALRRSAGRAGCNSEEQAGELGCVAEQLRRLHWWCPSEAGSKGFLHFI